MSFFFIFPLLWPKLFLRQAVRVSGKPPPHGQQRPAQGEQTPPCGRLPQFGPRGAVDGPSVRLHDERRLAPYVRAAAPLRPAQVAVAHQRHAVSLRLHHAVEHVASGRRFGQRDVARLYPVGRDELHEVFPSLNEGVHAVSFRPEGDAAPLGEQPGYFAQQDFVGYRFRVHRFACLLSLFPQAKIGIIPHISAPEPTAAQ